MTITLSPEDAEKIREMLAEDIPMMVKAIELWNSPTYYPPSMLVNKAVHIKEWTDQLAETRRLIELLRSGI